MKADAFRYDGKRAVVVGGATGMGAAVAELVQDLGAEVIVMDFAPVTLAGAKAINLDLRDKASIDAALDECGGPIHALFSCAGVADGTAGIEKINFIGHRHLIDRAIAKGSLGRGSAIGFISSTAGLGWRKHLDEVKAYLDDAPDFDSAVAWIEANPDKASYTWSKQSINVYVQSHAFGAAEAGHPGERDPARAHRHAARPRQRGDVARLRHRLPRRRGDRGVTTRRAGGSPRVPLQ